MTTVVLEKKNNVDTFFTKNIWFQKKGLSDFKKFIIKSWNKKIENISENIDTFLYK